MPSSGLADDAGWSNHGPVLRIVILEHLYTMESRMALLTTLLLVFLIMSALVLRRSLIMVPAAGGGTSNRLWCRTTAKSAPQFAPNSRAGQEAPQAW